MKRVLLPEIQQILLDEDEIQSRVRELAQELSRDFAGKDIVFIGVLKGAFVFLADLVRAMTIPLAIDFIACSSYGMESVSGGNLSITKDVSGVVQGRELIIVEDIVDTGLTLRELTDFLNSKQPAGVHTVSLLDKPSRRRLIIEADYVGFTIPEEFVVGYGLDFAEKFRELPYIGILKPEVYRS